MFRQEQTKSKAGFSASFALRSPPRSSAKLAVVCASSSAAQLKRTSTSTSPVAPTGCRNGTTSMRRQGCAEPRLFSKKARLKKAGCRLFPKNLFLGEGRQPAFFLLLPGFFYICWNSDKISSNVRPNFQNCHQRIQEFTETC